MNDVDKLMKLRLYIVNRPKTFYDLYVEISSKLMVISFLKAFLSSNHVLQYKIKYV